MENENTSLIVRLLSISNKGTALKKDNLLKSYKSSHMTPNTSKLSLE